jgi:hypothetical protein
MLKESRLRELELILELIARFPEGATLEEIIFEMKGAISKRTLQRRLAVLLKNDRLRSIGKILGRSCVL